MIDDPVENIDAQIEAIIEQTEDLSIFGIYHIIMIIILSLSLL